MDYDEFLKRMSNFLNNKKLNGILGLEVYRKNGKAIFRISDGWENEEGKLCEQTLAEGFSLEDAIQNLLRKENV
ncbi:MAG: hypothetical protein QXH80_00030 [Candidatus Nanoarchaeia archaeon]